MNCVGEAETSDKYHYRIFALNFEKGGMMKVTLMRDANKLYSDRSEREDYKRKMEAAEYKCFSLDEEKFRNLVFMHTNDYVWLLNDDLVDRLTPERKREG